MDLTQEDKDQIQTFWTEGILDIMDISIALEKSPETIIKVLKELNLL